MANFHISPDTLEQLSLLYRIVQPDIKTALSAAARRARKWTRVIEVKYALDNKMLNCGLLLQIVRPDLSKRQLDIISEIDNGVLWVTTGRLNPRTLIIASLDVNWQNYLPKNSKK